LHGAMSARNGITSILLAKKGFTGNKDPLLGPRGYFRLYCKSYHPEYLTRDLGKTFYAKGTHKKYPTCYGNHTVYDCALDLLRQHDINPEDIDEVVLSVSAHNIDSFLNQPFKMTNSQQRALFSYYYSVASVLLRKSVKLEHFTDQAVHDPKVVALASRVKVVPTQLAESRPDGSGGAGIKLTVKMKDGREFSASRNADPRGFLSNPLTREEIKEKFRANIDFSKTVSRKNAEKALAMLENLEEIDDASKIVKLLVA